MKKILKTRKTVRNYVLFNLGYHCFSYDWYSVIHKLI